MENTIIIEADGFISASLHKHLSESAPGLSLNLTEDENNYRSLTSDPQVLMVAITAGSTLISSIVAGLATIMSARIAAKQSSPPAQINIYTDNSDFDPELSIKVENIIGSTPESINKAMPELEQVLGRVRRIQYAD